MARMQAVRVDPKSSRHRGKCFFYFFSAVSLWGDGGSLSLLRSFHGACKSDRDPAYLHLCHALCRSDLNKTGNEQMNR